MDEERQPVLVPPEATVVSGGPRVLREGEIDPGVTSAGWSDDDQTFRHHPRTLAGIKRDGRLLLVVVDGRNPYYSIGATLEESARIMQSLGARDAMNLEGGAASTMVIGNRVVNRPSDKNGERPVAHGILVFPVF